MVIVNRRLWLLTGYAVPRNEEESLFSRQALLWLHTHTHTHRAPAQAICQSVVAVKKVLL